MEVINKSVVINNDDLWLTLNFISMRCLHFRF